MHSGFTQTMYTSPYIPQDISHLNLVCDLRGCRRVKTHLSGTQKTRALHASTKAPREPAPPDGARAVQSQLMAQPCLEASGIITASYRFWAARSRGAGALLSPAFASG